MGDAPVRLGLATRHSHRRRRGHPVDQQGGIFLRVNAVIPTDHVVLVFCVHHSERLMGTVQVDGNSADIVTAIRPVHHVKRAAISTVICRQHLGGVISGAVVDDADIRGFHGLTQNRIERTLKSRSSISGDNYDCVSHSHVMTPFTRSPNLVAECWRIAQPYFVE